jgi:hypothetical protein
LNFTPGLLETLAFQRSRLTSKFFVVGAGMLGNEVRRHPSSQSRKTEVTSTSEPPRISSTRAAARTLRHLRVSLKDEPSVFEQRLATAVKMLDEWLVPPASAFALLRLHHLVVSECKMKGLEYWPKLSVCFSRSAFSVIPPPHLDENVYQLKRPAAVQTSTKDSDGDHNIATGAFSFRAATAPSR